MFGKAAIFTTPRGRMEVRDVTLPVVDPEGVLVRITMVALATYEPWVIP